MNEETTKENVIEQLMYEWDEKLNDEGDYVPVKVKQLMTEAEARALVERHNDVFERCRIMRSMAYYTAIQIITAEEESHDHQPNQS